MRARPCADTRTHLTLAVVLAILLGCVVSLCSGLSTTHRAPPSSSAPPPPSPESGQALAHAERSVLIQHAPQPTPDGTLLVSTLDGTLHALDLRSGEYMWSFGAGAQMLHSAFEQEAKVATRAPERPTSGAVDGDESDDDDTDHASLHTLLTHHEQLQQELNDDLASGDLIFDQDEEEHTGHPRAPSRSRTQQHRTRAGEMKRRDRSGDTFAGGRSNVNRPASSTGPANSSSPLMIPGVDGSLFYSGTHGLQRLPISVAELVEAAPFKTGDNTRYLGFKETNVFLIHRNTGALKRVFSPMHTHAFSLYEECEEDECDPHLIWVAKTDLTVHAIDGRTGRLRWNVSISTYAPFDNTEAVAELTEAELAQAGYPEIGVSVSGTVHAVDIAAQRILWTQPLHSPVTSVFLVRPEQPDAEPTGGPDADINIQLHTPGDMIKLPHFYFDMATSTPAEDPLAAMVAHYHRSRDLAEVTTFTYVGQTKNGLIYALPNPQPVNAAAKVPYFVDAAQAPSPTKGTLAISAAAAAAGHHAASKPSSGAATITAIGVRAHSDTEGEGTEDETDLTCVPTSPSYPRCLLGFHALNVASGNSGAAGRNQQLLLRNSVDFYNKSVRPQQLPVITAPHVQPPRREDRDVEEEDEDDDGLVSRRHSTGVVSPRPTILLPPPASSTTHTPASLASAEFWWTVGVISMTLAVAFTAAVYLLQRSAASRKVTSGASAAKKKTTKRDADEAEASPGTPSTEEEEEEPEAEWDDKPDAATTGSVAPASSLRKRRRKPTRQTSDPSAAASSAAAAASVAAAAVPAPNSSGSLVARKTHFSTYESEVPSTLSSSNNSTTHSGESKAMRPRKHIQTRPDPAQMNSDAALSSVSPTLNRVFSTTQNNPDGSVTIGSMVLFPQKVLGTGSMGTVVYAGTFGGRPCAIKRLVKPFFGSANAAQEISLLIQSDAHPNVLRYYAKDEDTSFIYLALEQCVGTIQDLVTEQKDVPHIDQTKAILHGMMTGLAHLHSLHIVHRDIKPGNILLTSRGSARTVVLADMGLGKQLSMSRSSFDSVVSGSVGWQAPEVLNANGGRLTKAVDVFSAGAVMHFVLTNGQHPFGDHVERELNIAHNRMDLSALRDQPEARDVIGCMLHPDPRVRMSAEDVVAHPFFWPAAQQLTFLLEASDRFEAEPEHSELRMCLESQAVGVVGDNWHAHLHQGLLDNLGKYRKYNCASVRDLLRVIRNKKNHYRDLPLEVRTEVGPLPDGFLSYFTSRFPALLIYVYSVLACFALESPASQQGDQYSYSPLDLDHAHSSASAAAYDELRNVESVAAFYHKPLRDYPELKFSAPQFEPFYEHISLRRLVQLQKLTRLRFRHWHVPEDRWLATAAPPTAAAASSPEDE